jgi:hypothetical protein
MGVGVNEIAQHKWRTASHRPHFDEGFFRHFTQGEKPFKIFSTRCGMPAVSVTVILRVKANRYRSSELAAITVSRP